MLHQPWLQYAFYGVIFALVLFRRFKRMGRARRLRLETLWIFPTILIAIAALSLAAAPPAGFAWAWIAIGLAAGAAVGWYRARWIEIAVDPESGQLNQRESPAALIFIIALMAARWMLRSAMMTGAAGWHIGAALIADIFLAFGIGVLSFYRIEIYLRARRLMGEFNPSG